MEDHKSESIFDTAWLAGGIDHSAIVAGAPAWAQSKKYPPEPVDKDDLDQQKSQLWDQATNPAQVPYQALIKEAQKLLAENRPDATRQAVQKLTEAIPLMQNEPEAYRVRGDEYMALQEWGKCAADYDAAWSRLRRDVDAKNTPTLWPNRRRQEEGEGAPVTQRDDFHGNWNYVIKPRAKKR